MTRLRHLIRHPFTTATMVVVLALGIGVNAALFTVAHSLATQSPPGVRGGESLVRIRGITTDDGSGTTFGRPLSYDEFREYGAQTAIFREVAGWATGQATLDVGAGPVLTGASYVTGDLFGILGVRPAAGGGLPATRGAASSAPELVAVIDHGLWQTAFGASTDVIGKAVRVNGAMVTVVGVAPPRFRGVEFVSVPHLVWMPLSARAVVQAGAAVQTPDSVPLHAVALLQPGVSVEEAGRVARSVAARVAGGRPASSRFTEASVDVVPVLALNENPSLGTEAAALGTYAALTLLILLVAGTTVSALFVGVGVARRREIAVRLALGGGRLRIVRELLVEGVVVAVAGAVLGVSVLRLLLHMFAQHLPGVDLVVDPVSLAATLGFAVGVGILCSLSPALHATRLSVSEVLKRSSAGAPCSRLLLQRRLVACQIALSQPLLVGVGALVVLLARDARVGSGSPIADHVVVVDFAAGQGMSTSLPRADARRLLTDISAEVRAMPGVRDAIQGSGGYALADFAERPGGGAAPASFRAHGYYAAPGYFEVMGIPLVRGRGFEVDDVDAVVIGSDLARRLWGDADPLGRRLEHSWRGRVGEGDVVVIGVYDSNAAGPSMEGGLGGGMRVFVPASWTDAVRGAVRMYPSGASPLRILARVDGPARPLIPGLSKRVRDRAGALHVASISTAADLDARRRAGTTRMMEIAAGGGLLALLLASIGLYAVVALGVSERTREIGIRMAVGGRADQVVAVYFRQGLRLSLTGLALGLPLSVFALRWIGGPLAMTGGLLSVAGIVVVAVMGVASLATWVPARRAAGVDPAATLQAE